jgi:hypothetical protein
VVGVASVLLTPNEGNAEPVFVALDWFEFCDARPLSELVSPGVP